MKQLSGCPRQNFSAKSLAFNTSEKVPSPFFEMSLSEPQVLVNSWAMLGGNIKCSPLLCGDVWRLIETNGILWDHVGWNWKLFVFPVSPERPQNRRRPDLHGAWVGNMFPCVCRKRSKETHETSCLSTWNIFFYPSHLDRPGPPTMLPMLPALPCFHRSLLILTRVWNQRLSTTALIEVEHAQFHMGAKSQNHQLLIK